MPSACSKYILYIYNMEDFECIDTHFHIWELQRFTYAWPTATEAPIFRDFSATDLVGSVQSTPVRHAVFVQCQNNNPDEAKWVMEEAKKNPIMKGIVAGVDLTDPNLHSVLDDLQKNPLFKGCRHILDFEAESWITREDVGKGLKILEDRGLTYDLLLRPHLLKYIPQVVSKFPRLKFVVDHIAKPYIKDKVIDGWKEEIAAIAQFPNVCCKLSGLVTEADWGSWKMEDFVPYTQHILSCFGIDRCMFGSDWPVCKLAHAEYKDVFDLLSQLTSSLSAADRRKLFRDNAIKFYNLNVDN